jgi:hypothetical protein
MVKSDLGSRQATENINGGRRVKNYGVECIILKDIKVLKLEEQVEL